MKPARAFCRDGAASGPKPRRAARAFAELSVLSLLAASLLTGCPETTIEAQPVTPQGRGKVIVCAPGSYTAGAECIPVTAPECPSGTRPQDGQCVANDAVQQVAEEPPASPVTAISDFEDVLDPRRIRLQPRSRQLQITELQGLETLFQSTPKDGADRPKLMRRLAEGYVELEAASIRDRNEALQRSGPSAPRADAAKWKEQSNKAEMIMRAAARSAIKYYGVLIQQYPSFCLIPNAADPSRSTGCHDETLFYLGLEYLRQKEFDNGRKTFLQLIQQFPKSELVPAAYFVFGELFRSEAKGDPTKWPLAQQAYAQVAKYPNARILPAGLLRLGESQQAQGDIVNAKATYKELQDKFPDSDAASRVPAGMP